MSARVFVLVALAGCSSILGIEDLSGPGNTTPDSGSRDAGPDVMIGERVNLTGTASQFDLQQGGGMTIAGAVIDFVKAGMPVQTTQTTPDGAYVFSLPTNGLPIDGFLVLHQSAAGTYPHTHVVPPILTGDREFGVITFPQDFIQQLASFAGQSHDPAQTFVVFQVTSLGGGAAGITIQCEIDNEIIYADASGLPRQGEVQTSSMGIAYMFNAPPFLGLCAANGPQGSTQRRIETITPSDPLTPGVLAVSLEVSGE